MELMKVDNLWVQILISGNLDVWAQSLVLVRHLPSRLNPQHDCDRICAEDATKSSKISQRSHLSSIVPTCHVDCRWRMRIRMCTSEERMRRTMQTTYAEKQKKRKNTSVGRAEG